MSDDKFDKIVEALNELLYRSHHYTLVKVMNMPTDEMGKRARESREHLLNLIKEAINENDRSNS